MKNLILILAMCMTTSAFAQNSFPTENAIWNESIRNSYFIYGLLGDTTFNGITYSKLLLLGDTILEENTVSLYIGGFRNVEQKVFFKPAIWEHPDILLYDFGAEVGDIVWHNAWIPHCGSYYNNIEPCDSGSFMGCYSVVTAITIDENNRKKYAVESEWGWFCNWYEGIGSDRGVLRSLPTDFPIGDDISIEDFQLNCFKHNDIVKFLNNPKCNKCFCPFVNIKEETKNTENIKIYPNPTNSQLTIKNERLGIVALEVKILDLTGKIVFKEKVMNNANIDVSYLQAGIYFLEINNQTTKIIIK